MLNRLAPACLQHKASEDGPVHCAAPGHTLRSPARNVWLGPTAVPARLRASATRVVRAGALIAAATVVRTNAARGRTRPVSPATVVRLAGAVTRRRPRVIRTASAVAPTAVVRWARAIARRWSRLIRVASAIAPIAAVRRARAVTRSGPRVISAASAVTTGTAIRRCRSLANDGRAYCKCARLRTGASHVFPEVAPAAAGLAHAVGCSSELTS